MKKFIYNIIGRLELFAERVYYRTGLEILPPKWRVSMEMRFNPVFANLFSDYLAAGGDVDIARFIEMQEARR